MQWPNSIASHQPTRVTKEDAMTTELTPRYLVPRTNPSLQLGRSAPFAFRPPSTSRPSLLPSKVHLPVTIISLRRDTPSGRFPCDFGPETVKRRPIRPCSRLPFSVLRQAPACRGESDTITLTTSPIDDARGQVTSTHNAF